MSFNQDMSVISKTLDLGGEDQDQKSDWWIEKRDMQNMKSALR